jgi:hypothetical protein
MDYGKLSTYIISGAMIIFAAILADPSLVEPLMGDFYSKFVALVPLLIVVFNAYYPRPINKKE